MSEILTMKLKQRRNMKLKKIIIMDNEILMYGLIQTTLSYRQTIYLHHFRKLILLIMLAMQRMQRIIVLRLRLSIIRLKRNLPLLSLRISSFSIMLMLIFSITTASNSIKRVSSKILSEKCHR